jgi:hypothetical protein
MEITTDYETIANIMFIIGFVSGVASTTIVALLIGILKKD